MAAKNVTPRAEYRVVSGLRKPPVEARTIVTDHSTPRKQERPNLTLENRLRLAHGAAWELEALAVRIRAEKNADFEQDVALNAFADRLDVIASALMEVANPEEDQHHDAAELQRILRFAPTAD